MIMKTFWPAVAAAGLLTACGGSSDDTAPAASGATTYATGLAQLNTSAGLTDPSLADAFDNAYLDAGMTKAQVVDALGQESLAMRASTEHSLFPQVVLSNVSVSNCDAQNVCTLTGTLFNGDGDGTSVDFSTKAVNSNGTYRLLGDQQSS
jgi:hypothetical protein